MRIFLTILLLSVLIFSCKKKQEVSSTQSIAAPVMQEDKDLKVMPLRIDKELQLPVNSDDCSIGKMEVIGDSLIMEVSYGGGCQIHEFELLTNGMYGKSLPMQLNLYLRHNANNDMCRAYFTKRIAFSLQAIRHSSAKELHLFVNNNREQRLVYTY